MDKMKLAGQLSRIENLIPKAPSEIKNAKDIQGGAPETAGTQGSFKDTLEGLISNMPAQETPKAGANLAKAAVAEAGGLKFSNHAIERMQSRGISLDPSRLAKLDEAVKKAAAKGSKDTLVLMDECAAIVSVKNNTVVTVMDKNNLKENVFTNIDSTIVI
jgi:flagellar operon protein